MIKLLLSLILMSLGLPTQPTCAEEAEGPNILVVLDDWRKQTGAVMPTKNTRFCPKERKQP